jgi:hypothetical protein
MASLYLFGQQVQVTFRKEDLENPRQLADMCMSLPFLLYGKGIKLRETDTVVFRGLASAISRCVDEAWILLEYNLHFARQPS